MSKLRFRGVVGETYGNLAIAVMAASLGIERDEDCATRISSKSFSKGN